MPRLPAAALAAPRRPAARRAARADARAPRGLRALPGRARRRCARRSGATARFCRLFGDDDALRRTIEAELASAGYWSGAAALALARCRGHDGAGRRSWRCRAAAAASARPCSSRTTRRPPSRRPSRARRTTHRDPDARSRAPLPTTTAARRAARHDDATDHQRAGPTPSPSATTTAATAAAHDDRLDVLGDRSGTDLRRPTRRRPPRPRRRPPRLRSVRRTRPRRR